MNQLNDMEKLAKEITGENEYSLFQNDVGKIDFYLRFPYYDCMNESNYYWQNKMLCTDYWIYLSVTETPCKTQVMR